MSNPSRSGETPESPTIAPASTPGTPLAAPAGSNVSGSDYEKCIKMCAGLGNSEQIRICMEGCRYIDSRFSVGGGTFSPQ